MNQEVLGYISAVSDVVPRTWTVDDLRREIEASFRARILVVGHSTQWRSRIRNEVSQPPFAPVRLAQNRLTWVNETEVTFAALWSENRFQGTHWNRAYIQELEIVAVNEPGTMPVYRIPAQADWHDVSDAVQDAQEFLRTHEGEVEFDFQGNRYKVPYGCDYGVLVGSIMPQEPRFRFGFSDWRAQTQPIDFRGLLASDSDPGATMSPTYAGISRSSAPTAPATQMPHIPQHLLEQVAAMNYEADFNTMNGNPEGAAIARQRSEQMMNQAIEQAQRRFADAVFRPSPIFERLRSVDQVAFNGGSEMRPPIQFRLPDPIHVDPNAPPNTLFWARNSDPLDFPEMRPGARMHLSEIAEYDVGHSSRELDLQRRLDTVSECLHNMMPEGLRLRRLVFEQPGPGQHTQIVRHVPDADAQRLADALDYESAAVQDLDYVSIYRFAGGQALRVNDKLEFGTILDAAGRPRRKFRLVEE